jgi:hypothetical protein
LKAAAFPLNPARNADFSPIQQLGMWTAFTVTGIVAGTRRKMNVQAYPATRFGTTGGGSSGS